jgi:hypothetical protein
MVLRRVTNNIEPHLNRQLRRLGGVAKSGADFFIKTTPIKTGNARRNTRFTARSTGGTITGDYPYVNRLNEGYSRQAPEGMTNPTIARIRALVRKILG